MNHRIFAGASAAGLLLCAGVRFASATLITLSDSNSVARFKTQSQDGPVPGMNYWSIDGGNQLANQWFWYRIGETGPERSIDTLTPTAVHVGNAGFGGSNNQLSVDYAGDRFRLTLTCTLMGGSPGSGTADISEMIRIDNTSASPLAFHLFQYSDFDLNSLAAGDLVRIRGGNTAQQSKALFFAQETVATPRPSHIQAALSPAIYTLLTDGAASILNDDPGPCSGAVEYTFQWDANIAPGGTFIIATDKRIEGVPEPASLAALAIASAFCLMSRRRR